MEMKIDQDILKKYFFIDVLSGTIKDHLENHENKGSEGQIYIHMEDKGITFASPVKTTMAIYYEDPDDQIRNIIMPSLREKLEIDDTTRIEIHNFDIHFLNGPDKINIECTLRAKGFLPLKTEKSIKWTNEFQTVISNILKEHGITIV